ncbi:MAG: stage III sporulation protein AE [Oscillospiraceae bacterium]|nr:stage III sporulation protein AE [Oscillospiraceae bacterium]
MRKLCVAICLILLLSVDTAWGQTVPGELTDALSPEAEQILDSLGQRDFDHNALIQGLDRLWQLAWSGFGRLFQSGLGGAVLLLGVVLLCGVVDNMGQASDDNRENYVTLAGALVITVTTAGTFRSMTVMGMDAMEQMDIFAKALLPTLAAAVAAGGGIVSAGVHQVLTVMFTNVLISAIRQLLPFVYLYVAVAVANAALPEHDLKGLRDGIAKAIKGVLTGLMVVFTAFLTLFGAVGTAADAAALRLTKSAISAAVPVVGSIISDATESVLASAGILKNAVGVFGMLGVLAICLTPFLHLAVQYVLYKLSAFLSSVVGSGPLVELINALGTAFGLLLGMTGACAVLLLISVASSVRVVIS